MTRVSAAGVMASVLVLAATAAEAQRDVCPPTGWTLTRLEALKRDQFKLPDAFQRNELATALAACLGNPNPALRDGIAFEALSAWMRGAQLELATMKALRADLLRMIASPDDRGFTGPFSALVLAEVARSDRLAPWMSAAERDEMVAAAATFLQTVADYRSFDQTEGFRHGVAHGADFALQLGLNAAVTRPQLDRLLAAIATQVAPSQHAYWAGEPDRLARPVVFIAQRKLHTGAEWAAWFERASNPSPLPSWKAAFSSESGIRKRHNVRAFLLSAYASATISEDLGVRQLIGPITAALKTVP